MNARGRVSQSAFPTNTPHVVPPKEQVREEKKKEKMEKNKNKKVSRA